MQRVTYVMFINLTHYFVKRPVPAVRVVNSRFRLCTSLVPRPTMWYLAWERGYICACLENGVLHNGQQPQSVVNFFFSV